MTTPSETEQRTIFPVSTGEDDLFIASLALNLKNFDSGLFDNAYHALFAALHLAQITGNYGSFFLVERTAREQLVWIDQNAPGYRHSSVSTLQRGYKSPGIWEVLATMAQAHAESAGLETVLDNLPPMPQVGDE